MARRAAELRIHVSAGVAELIIDMEKANASVRKFTQTAEAGSAGIKSIGSAGHAAVTGVQAVSGTLRVLEGGIANNLRAAERFVADVVGLGPALQKIFPVVGAIAFTGILVKMGTEAREMLHEFEYGTQKVTGQMHELTTGIRLSNAELDLSNAKLEQQIAKLEGKRENTIAVLLDDARVAADKLAESLDRDLQGLQKLFEQRSNGNWENIKNLLGFDARNDTHIQKSLFGETGFGGFRGQVQEVMDKWTKRIEASIEAQDLRGVNDQIEKSVQEIGKNYADMVGYLDREIRKAQEGWPKFNIEHPGTPFANNPALSVGLNRAAERAYDATKDYVAELREIQRGLQAQRESAEKQLRNYQLRSAESIAQADKNNIKLDQPFDNKIKELNAQIEEAQVKLDAAGGSAVERVMAEATAKTIKSIQLVNQELDRRTPGAGNILLEDQRGQQIKTKETTIALTNAQTEWQNRLRETTLRVREETTALDAMTKAIGQGYEATKRASVEVAVIKAVTPERYFDQKWMDDARNQADVARVRAAEDANYEAQHRRDLAQTADRLSDNIALSKRLADVQEQGAAAIRFATLQHNIELAKQKDGLDATLVTSKMLAEFYAKEAELTARNVAGVQREIEAIRALEQGQLRGAKAAREAKNEANYAQIRKDTSLPGESGMTAEEYEARLKDIADREMQVGEAVERRVYLYSNQLEALEEEKAYLEKNYQLYKDTADYARAIRDLDDARLKIAVQQTLEVGRARDGVRAFFLDMQTQAKKTSVIIYDALQGAVDGVSDSLSKTMTGQQGQWARMFQNLGQNLLKESLKAQIETTLGNIGKKFGITIPGLDKPDGSTAQKALWVRMLGGAGLGTSPIDNGGFVGSGGVILRRAGGGPHSPGNILFGNGGLMGTGEVPGGEEADRRASAKLPAPPSIPVGTTGIGSTADGSQAHPFFVVVTNIPAGPNAAQSAAGPVSQILGAILGGGVPKRAGGGGASAGMAYLVGERGPELFVPDANGTVVANASMRRMGSGGNSIYVDASNSTDPVETKRQVMQGMKIAYDSAVRTGVQVNHDAKRRMPQSRRF